MRCAALFFAVVLGACGPAPTVCTAAFSGNFFDASSGACPTLDGTTFRFRADAPAVNSALVAMIALGDVPASATSQTATGDWSAVLTREPGCVYTAGRGATPPGTYVLTLSSTVPLHGSLVLEQVVHALPMADCGRGDLETVRLQF